jgi:predicted secreted protein
MTWPAALAIYILFWVMTAFFILPFHARKVRAMGSDLVRGQEVGAPPVFLAGWTAKWTTVWASGAFALYYLAYTRGWVDVSAWVNALGPG